MKNKIKWWEYPAWWLYQSMPKPVHTTDLVDLTLFRRIPKWAIVLNSLWVTFSFGLFGLFMYSIIFE